MDLEQQHEKHSGDLRKRVRLAENAGAKIPQPGNREQHSTGGKNRGVPAEDQHGKLPGNLVQDGEHQKHRTQQKLVGDGIKVLTEERLLMQLAREQAVESIAETCDHED